MDPTTPWTRADALAAAALMAVGGLVWFSGWWAVTGRSSMEAQIAPMNVVVFGAILIAAGQALWFQRGRRAVSKRRQVLLAPGTAMLAPEVPERFGTDRPADLLAGSERFFHRLDCVLATDRAWAPASRAAHEGAGRVPCGVCDP